MNVKKYFLIFLQLIIYANSMLFANQLTIQCRNNHRIQVDYAIKDLLPVLFIGQKNTTRIIFSRTYQEGDKLHIKSWSPTAEYMQKLIYYAVNPTNQTKRELLNSASCPDLLMMYIDYNFLLADKHILNYIKAIFLSKFITEYREKKDHWMFLFAQSTKKKDHESCLKHYWKKKITDYLSNNIDDINNNTCMYIPPLIIQELTNLIPIVWFKIEKLFEPNSFFTYSLDDEKEFCRKKKFVYTDTTLDLTSYALDDAILYKTMDRDFPKDEFMFNGIFLLDFLCFNYYYLNFTTKKIILDNNNITRLPISEFIKCFPNLQCISVKKCPINRGILECNTDVYFCNREDFLCSGHSIILEGGSVTQSTKIMWNGMGFPSEQYDQINNNNPLTIIYDNSNKKYFDQCKNYYNLPNIKFINADTPNNDVPQKDNLFTIIKKKVFFTIILTKIICNQIARKLISYLYFLK